MTIVKIDLEEFDVYLHKFGTTIPTTVDEFDIIVHTAKGLTPEMDFSDYFAYNINGLAYKKSYVGTDTTTNKDTLDDYKRPTKLVLEMFSDSISYKELNTIYEWQQSNQEIIIIDGACKSFSYDDSALKTDVTIGAKWGTAITDYRYFASYFGGYSGYIINAPGDFVHPAKLKSNNIITLDIAVKRVGISTDRVVDKLNIKGCTYLYEWFTY